MKEYIRDLVDRIRIKRRILQDFSASQREEKGSLASKVEIEVLEEEVKRLARFIETEVEDAKMSLSMLTACKSS